VEDPTRRDIREINYKIEDIEKSVGLLLRGRRKEVIAELMETCFKKSVEKVRVFLAIDGQSSINQIAARLEIKPPNVSRHIKDLLDHDLINVRTTVGGKVIYEKTSQVRRIRLEEFLFEAFGKALAPQDEAAAQVGQEGVANAGESGVQGSNTVPGA
jgi:DNA-binding transcriptional ArsR family regulator